MASIGNISSLANINKDTIVDGAKTLLASKKNELVDKFISAKTEIINQIKIDSEELVRQKILGLFVILILQLIHQEIK